MTFRLFTFLLCCYLVSGLISFFLLRKTKWGLQLLGVLMTAVLIWQIVQYSNTFGLATGFFKDVEARFGMIGAMIWGAGGMLFASVIWRLIGPLNK